MVPIAYLNRIVVIGMVGVREMAHMNLGTARRALGTWMIPVLVALLEGLTHFGRMYSDSGGYVSMVKLLRGTAGVEEAQVIHWHGILRPVVPTLALPLSYLMSYRDAIATVNLGFLLLGTLFVYLLTRRLLNNRGAFVSAVCFASAFPNLFIGTAVLTDGPGYALEIITLYFLLFVLGEKKDFRNALFAGVLIGIGGLTKETNLIVIPVFLFLRLLLHRDRLNMSSALLAATIGIAIPLAWSQFVGFGYLAFYGQGLAFQTPGYNGLLLNPKLFALSAAYAFGLCLPFAFIGFFNVDDERFKTFCEILLSVGILLAMWPTAPEYRFTFLAFPAVLPLAASGMDKASEVLARRPWLNRLSQRSWLVLFLLATVALTNVASFRLYFRTPL